MSATAGAGVGVGAFGELGVTLPRAIRRAVSAGDRLRHWFSLFEGAEQHARHPRLVVPDLRAEREACGLKDAMLDRVIASGHMDAGVLRVQHTDVFHRVMVEALEDMAALLALSGPTTRRRSS